MNIEAIITKIDGLEGSEQEHAEWLLTLLDHPSALVRISAIRPLIYRCNVPTLKRKLSAMIDSETDEDVLLLVISGLALGNTGSRDGGLIRRFTAAIERLGGGLIGTRETLDDAKLRVMLGLDSAQLVRISSEERAKHLAEIDAQLLRRRSQTECD